MAQNTTVAVPEGIWTQLTNADVTNITFQNVGGNFVKIKATTDTTTPTSDSGAARYNPGQGERNQPLLELFPGIAGVRLWAFSPSGKSEVVISHA